MTAAEAVTGLLVDPENVKYTLPNYGSSNNWELAQYINRVVAMALCLEIHINIVIRLLVVNKCRLKSDYQILIIVQSVINIIAAASELVLNEIQTINRDYVKVGHPWWNFSLAEKLIFTMIMAISVNSTQDFLMLFNLHRLVLIRNGNLVRLYCIALPIMLIGVCSDAFQSYPVVLAGQDIDLFFMYSQVPFLLAVIIYCYWKLKKEFATNRSYSEKTKRLQEKLSLSIMCQVVMLTVITVILNVIPWLLESILAEEQVQEHAVYYTIIVLMVTQWYPFLSATFIVWSITGFFKNESAAPTIRHSDVKIFQVEPEPTARKQSRAQKLSV